MRRTLLYTVTIGCLIVAGLAGCGPSIDPEKTASPQGPTAKEQMDEEYKKQAEEMQKMQQQMRQRQGR